MTDDTRKKKRGRSKIFRSCFRFSDTDEGPSSDKSDDQDSKTGRLGKPVLIAVSGRKGKDFIPDVNLVNGNVADSGVDCYVKRSSSSRRRISRVLKAVLFDTMMSKKIVRSSSKSSIASDTSLSSLSSEKTGKSFNDSKVYGGKYTNMDDSSSRRSNSLSSSSRTASSLLSSSCSSSINSNSRSSCDQKASSRIDLFDFRHPVLSNSLTLRKPNPMNSISQSLSEQKESSSIDSLDSKIPVSSNSHSLTKPNPEKIKSGGNNLNIRLYLFLLLSLFVLVIWGRIFSILCTSVWFYFVPCRRIRSVDSVTNAVESLDANWEQYKKRVIMAGLLERSRNSSR